MIVTATNAGKFSRTGEPRAGGAELVN